MEEQAPPAASTPPPAPRCDSSPQQTPTRPTTPQAVLSNSEPFLRFPRPQGNRRLANWISASDPDIMRLTTTATEDTGLAESAYELIVGTDTESQDGNYAESMGDSVGSLNLHRPDDVHSLSGTEETYDGESLADEADALPQAPMLDGVGEPPGGQDKELDGAADDDVSCHAADDVLVSQSQEPDISGPDKEARLRCSLEYTQHSLKTPSILATPEVINFKKPFDIPIHELQPNEMPPGPPLRFSQLLADIRDCGSHIKNCLAETTSAALPGLLFMVAFVMLIPALYMPRTKNPESDASLATPTVTATATPSAISASKASSSACPTPTSVGGVDLILLGDDASEEWLFGAKRAAVSFTPQAQTDILIRVPADARDNWLAKSCLEVTGTKDYRRIETSMFPVADGILLRFPKKEAHGVVNLSLKATCRPKVQKMVKVHFGRGIMEEAYEMAKNLAQDLSGLVPVAAQKAERCFAGARRSLGAVFDTVSNSVIFVSDNLLKRASNAVAGAQRSLGEARSDALSRIRGATEDISEGFCTVSQLAMEHLYRVQDLQNLLQLGLLDAQLSARMWWLKATGQKEAHDDYQRKAREFAAKKQAAAREASQARRSRTTAETSASGP